MYIPHLYHLFLCSISGGCLFHIIPVPSTIGKEYIVSLCLSVHKIKVHFAPAAVPVCLLPPMSIFVPTSLRTLIVATPCISTHFSHFLSALCFMSSKVVCGRDQLPLHPSVLVMVMVAACHPSDMLWWPRLRQLFLWWAIMELPSRPVPVRIATGSCLLLP